MRISDWSSDVCSSDLERIITSVINDSVLSDRKGLNRLGGGLSLGALTDRDRELIGIAVEMDVDFIAVSFCRNAADLEAARAVARAHGSHARSEERRVGEGGGSTCRSRWWPYH